MKRMLRSLPLKFLAGLALTASAHAHGLHAPAEPPVHVALHVAQVVGLIALVAVVGVWVRSRVRR